MVFISRQVEGGEPPLHRAQLGDKAGSRDGVPTAIHRASMSRISSQVEGGEPPFTGLNLETKPAAGAVCPPPFTGQACFLFPDKLRAVNPPSPGSTWRQSRQQGRHLHCHSHRLCGGLVHFTWCFVPCACPLLVEILGAASSAPFRWSLKVPHRLVGSSSLYCYIW